jgi:RNA polymerase sigma-70 factor (ECF subfamily)
MHQTDDRAVIAAVLSGDTNAYAVLVERYQKPIFNLMYRMTRSYEDAVDLAQDTFIKAYEQLHRFKDDKRFFPWLYTIGWNHSKNFQRRKRYETVPIEDWDLGSGLDYPAQEEERMCSRLDYRLLYEALDELPADYREVLVLRYREEFPVEDIAAALGLSESGVRMRIHRGLKKLREILRKNGHEEERFASLG